ncbi:hypothetical protein AVEN_268143-1 [Araneus ventricosus]|uniref:Uncharacterized protein n=1 Tax=Araneus ventricosus TaxID=182803 RepID=A0A4Y2X7G4_ARAVE|nr:hypothetical protein AVEN_39326-1 [Araneus ventricosus]GBO45521.1 hypothetical protein AVEN_268143-1 [Araneus ventricosus]
MIAANVKSPSSSPAKSWETSRTRRTRFLDFVGPLQDHFVSTVRIDHHQGRPLADSTKCSKLARATKAAHSPMFHSTFFGTQDAKPIRRCEIPMKIGTDRLRNCNSNEVGFPLEWMAIKMKYDSSRRVINHPCVGEC